MGDTDAAAMARMTAEVEEEEVDVMELVRRLQESRSEGMRDEPGTGASATAAKAHEKGFASLVKTTGVATLDEESKKGQFGWFPVLGVQMPYIIRSETPYIPTKVTFGGLSQPIKIAKLYTGNLRFGFLLDLMLVSLLLR